MPDEQPSPQTELIVEALKQIAENDTVLLRRMTNLESDYKSLGLKVRELNDEVKILRKKVYGEI